MIYAYLIHAKYFQIILATDLKIRYLIASSYW